MLVDEATHTSVRFSFLPSSTMSTDLRTYFDNVRHFLLLQRVARRVQDDEVMRLLKMILKATGKKGVPQGGVMTPQRTHSFVPPYSFA